VARDTRPRAADNLTKTRPAPRMSARRTVNPAARRRTIATFVLALIVLGGLLVAAKILTAPATVPLPGLHGLNAGQVTGKLNQKHLHARFVHEYSTAKLKTTIAQHPGAGTRVKKGSTVTVVLSKGPRPVNVPALTGKSSSTASATLRHLGLNPSVTTVPAPGTTPGIVARQSPTAGHQLKPRDTVELFVAETPAWRAITSFSAGSGSGHSVPFRILGSQWRIAYSMSYDGTCDFVFFCNGPSAQVLGLGANSTDQSFDLKSGSSETRVFDTGPGVYQINIKGGWDSARWSIEVEDWR